MGQTACTLGRYAYHMVVSHRQRGNPVFLHQQRLCTNNRVFIAYCNSSRDPAEIHVFDFFHNLFQKSVHTLPLDRLLFSIFWYHNFH